MFFITELLPCARQLPHFKLNESLIIFKRKMTAFLSKILRVNRLFLRILFIDNFLYIFSLSFV